jgi:hypothetical protein
MKETDELKSQLITILQRGDMSDKDKALLEKWVGFFSESIAAEKFENPVIAE